MLFAVGPQLFSVDDIKPTKIPTGEQRRACMRLTMSSVFAGSDKWQPVLAVHCGVRLQMTLDTAAAIVKANDAAGNPSQSNTFQIEGAVLLWDAITSDSVLQENYLSS